MSCVGILSIVVVMADVVLPLRASAWTQVLAAFAMMVSGRRAMS
jgi:hypothetical protein